MVEPKNRGFLGKTRLLLNGIFLVFSILTMAVATFAWFATNRVTTDKITLKTDDNALSIDAYAYHQGYAVDSEGDPVPAAYSKSEGNSLLNATKSNSDNEGNYQITFSSTALQAFAYGDLYSGELSMNENSFPHLYVELRYLKPALNGFLQATVGDLAYAPNLSGFTNITQELNYQYRFTTVQNTPSAKHINALRAANESEAYRSSAWTALGTTPSPVTLFNSTTDISGYNYDPSYTPLRQCYVPGFSSKHGSDYYYSKATILEFRVDPLAWVQYFNSHPGLSATSLNFGLSFNISLTFSSNAFFSNAKTPKLLVSKNSVNLDTVGTTTATMAAYNFTAVPTISQSSSVSGVASATLTGTNVAIAALGEGNTVLTLTATSGSETASATIAIGVYAGPTLVLSPSSLALAPGETGYVAVEAVLFTSLPALTAVSSNTNVATVTASSTSVVVVAVSPGTATISISGRNGNYTVYTSQCQVTVANGTRTLSSISVSSLPTKTSYVVGEAFNTVGLKISGLYSDGVSQELSGYRLNPNAGTIFTVAETKVITVSYSTRTTTFSVTVSANDGFRLVTTAGCLIPGERYLIATNATLSGGTTVLGATQGNDYRSAFSTIISSSTPPTITYNTAMETLTLNGSTNHWTFHAETSSGYLNYGGTGSTLLTTQDESATGNEWSISFDSATGGAYIQSATSAGTYLQYETASGHFNFGTTQTALYLFTNSLSVANTSITLVPTSLTLAKGDTADITALLGSGTTLVSAGVGDQSIANCSVTENSISVSAKKVGSTTITVVAKGNTGTLTVACPLTVTAASSSSSSA